MAFDVVQEPVNPLLPLVGGCPMSSRAGPGVGVGGRHQGCFGCELRWCRPMYRACSHRPCRTLGCGRDLAFDVVQKSCWSPPRSGHVFKNIGRVLGGRRSARVDDAARGRYRAARRGSEGGRGGARGLRRRPQGQDPDDHLLPLSLGRNFDELLPRVIKVLQTAAHFAVATPADWRPGEPIIVPTAGSCGTGKERMEGHVEGVKCEDWFFCTKDISADAIESAIRAAEMPMPQRGSAD